MGKLCLCQLVPPSHHVAPLDVQPAYLVSDYLCYNDVYRNVKTSIQIEHNALLSLAQLIYNNDECKNEFEANDGEYQGASLRLCFGFLQDFIMILPFTPHLSPVPPILNPNT